MSTEFLCIATSDSRNPHIQKEFLHFLRGGLQFFFSGCA